MKKLALLFLASVGLCFSGLAQDLSFDELARLRSQPFPSFETYAHNNGYKMDHLSDDYRCATFRKNGNTLSYCELLNKGMHSHCLPAVRYETSSQAEYERLKGQIEAKTKYLKTKMHRYATQEYMEHIYSSDEVVVHMYDITHGDYGNHGCYTFCKPHYVIEIFSIYSGR